MTYKICTFIKNVFVCHTYIKKKNFCAENVENHVDRVFILWEQSNYHLSGPGSNHFVLFIIRRCLTGTNRPAKKKCTCLWEPRTTGNRIWTTCAPSKWPFKTRTTTHRFSTKWWVHYSDKMIWYRVVGYIHVIVQLVVR